MANCFWAALLTTANLNKAGQMLLLLLHFRIHLVEDYVPKTWQGTVVKVTQWIFPNGTVLNRTSEVLPGQRGHTLEEL